VALPLCDWRSAVKTAELKELATLMSRQASTYSLLSRLYRVEVDQELLDSMRKMNFELPGDPELDDIREGYCLWRGYLAKTTEQTLTDLAVDYVRTFIGAGRSAKEAAYPYESIYTSPDRLLMQEARDEVLSLYRAEEISRVESFNEPEDHIALELEFMAVLCERAAPSLREGDTGHALGYLKKQTLFLTEHLLNWTPVFCADVVKFAREDLYRGLAMVTKGYLQLEKQVLQDVISEIA